MGFVAPNIIEVCVDYCTNELAIIASDVVMEFFLQLNKICNSAPRKGKLNIPQLALAKLTLLHYWLPTTHNQRLGMC